MKSVFKILRLSGYIILIVLASFGIGLAGGIPIPSSNKKDTILEIKIELVETDDDDEIKTTDAKLG